MGPPLTRSGTAPLIRPSLHSSHRKGCAHAIPSAPTRSRPHRRRGDRRRPRRTHRLCFRFQRRDSADGGAQDVTINQAVQTLLYLPLYVAEEKGYFEDEGVNVKIDTGGSGNASFAAVLGGSAGFSIQDPVFSAKSHEQGGEGVIVAGVQNAPAEFLVGKDGTSAQDDPTILSGKKVVVSPLRTPRGPS
ncbi:ABC transporter substrate-binding protein [Curtobacterium flaccumfaciens]|nr:ABC transporter substrate-binding protein [Curtobacterium flaccumfaciens]